MSSAGLGPSAGGRPPGPAGTGVRGSAGLLTATGAVGRPCIWGGVPQVARCPGHGTDSGGAVGSRRHSPGSAMGFPKTDTRASGPSGSRARLQPSSCTRDTWPSSQCGSRRPRLWPLGDPGCRHCRLGPPRASLALRFLLSWAGVDKGATRRCHSGQLEGEGGGSWATRSLEPRSLLGPGLRAQGLQERGPEMGYSESSLSRSESKL